MLAAIRRAALHPIVWIGIAAFIAWRGYSAFSPQVTRLDHGADGLLVVSGYNFGAARGESAVIYKTAGSEIEIEVDEWSNDRITARLADEVASGSVRVKRAFWFADWPSSEAALIVPEEGLPSKPFGYEVPVQAAAPWPSARRNRRNTAYLPLPAVYRGDTPWSFETGKSVSAAPVIDEQGVAYVGSADHNFYAINPNGSERWRYRTGGVISSAAVLLRADGADASPAVVVGSGDGLLYRLRTASNLRNPVAREAFAFDARVSPRSRDYSPFNGDIAVGYDGTLYAGNGNSSYYAISPKGELKWTYLTEGRVWSNAAFSSRTIFWGAQDSSVHALNPNGTAEWTKSTWGAITASAAIGSDGTVYIGSFDGNLYALDPATGDTRWTYQTGEHIVGSVALGENKSGSTDAIYLGSTDGRMYALNRKGELIWKYDTGDAIRSSPAVGLGTNGEQPGVVYFGGGNGKIYALNAINGQRRWSYNTTADEPVLHDRNDLNSPVALGPTGVYVGSESGRLWYVPYDYCLHATDTRCAKTPGEELPAEIAGLLYVSPGGTTYFDQPPPIAAASVITLRLMVRNGSQTVGAHLCNTPLLCSAQDLRIESEPAFPFRTEQSADGRYVHIIPEKTLEPGASYRLRVEGDYYTGGYRLGSFTVGGSRAGQFKDDITLRTRPSAGASPLLAKGDDVPAFEWTRVAVTIPSSMASVDQAAFDDVELIIGATGARPTADGAGKLIVWGIGGRRDDKGALVADPDSDVTLTLSGTYQGDSFALAGHGFNTKVGSASMAFDRLDLRGQFDSSLSVLPGATLFAVADAGSIPGVGPYLASDAANAIYSKVTIAGTYLTRAYRGPANKRPPGLQVSFVEGVPPTGRMPGQIVAHFRLARGASYKVAEHRLGIILIDRLRNEVVPLDYGKQITASASPQGDVSQVVLTVPEDSELPGDLTVVVLADVFPLHREQLEFQAQAR